MRTLSLGKRKKHPVFNIEKIIKKNYPKLYKKLSLNFGWKLLLLKLIIKEKLIVKYLTKFKQPTAQATINTLFKKQLKPKIIFKGLSKIKRLQKKRLIFVANHPLGGLDGLALLHILLPIFPTLKIIVNPLLQELSAINSVFLPAEVFKRSGAAEIKKLMGYFKQNNALIYFPAGKVARKINGKVYDSFWKCQLIKQAASAKRTLVALHIEAKNSFWFYFIAKLRTKLGITSNLEMLLLPRENLCRKKVKISISVQCIIPSNKLFQQKI